MAGIGLIHGEIIGSTSEASGVLWMTEIFGVVGPI